jgi:hypothetical protein
MLRGTTAQPQLPNLGWFWYPNRKRCANTSYAPSWAFSFPYLVFFCNFSSPTILMVIILMPSVMSQPRPATWLNEVSFCPHPQSTWQAAACAVAGLGARTLDTMQDKEAWTYSPPGVCGCCLTRTLGGKCINVDADVMSKYWRKGCRRGHVYTGRKFAAGGANGNVAATENNETGAGRIVTSMNVEKRGRLHGSRRRR